MQIDLNLNDAGPQVVFEPFPPGICKVKTKLRNNGVGDGLTLAKNLRTYHIEFEFEVIEGEHARRKILDWITVHCDEASTPDLPDIAAEELKKFRKSVREGRAKLCAMIESAAGIMPDDHSERAEKLRRQANDINSLNGFEPWAKVGIRKGTNGFSDRNNVQYFITRDMREWPAQRPPPAPVSSSSLPALRDEINDDIPF